MIWASGSAKSRPVAFLTRQLFKWLSTTLFDTKENENLFIVAPF